MSGKNSCAKKEVRVIDIRALMHGKKTGVEVYIEETLKSLFEQDSKNHYILFYNSLKECPLPNFGDHSNVEMLRTKIPNKFLNLSLSLFNWPKLDTLIEGKISKKVDLFFMPDLRPIALSRARLFTTFHDLSFERFPQFFSLRARIWHKLINPRKIAHNSDSIVAVSKFTKQELKDVYGLPDSKIQVIYEGSGSVVRQDRAQVQKIQKRLNLPKKYFLFVSSLEPRKNIERLAKAFSIFQKQHPEFKLVLIGVDNQRIFKEISISKQDSIIPLGFVTDEEKSAVIAGCHALVYPSLYEGFGLPILEAYALNKPVIASGTSSIPEVMGEAGIEINPLDIESIASALEKSILPKEYEKRQKLIPAQLAKFSWSKCAKNISDYFSFSR